MQHAEDRARGRLLKIPEVAERLGGVHPRTVSRMLADGEHPKTKIRGKVFVSEYAVDELIAQRTTRATPPPPRLAVQRQHRERGRFAAQLQAIEGGKR